MSAFVKTVVGDAWNLSVVAAIMFFEIALVFTGHAAIAAFVIPPFTLAGVAWLARH